MLELELLDIAVDTLMVCLVDSTDDTALLSLVDWLIDWLIDSLTDWLLVDWLCGGTLVDSLVDSLGEDKVEVGTTITLEETSGSITEEDSNANGMEEDSNANGTDEENSPGNEMGTDEENMSNDIIEELNRSKDPLGDTDEKNSTDDMKSSDGMLEDGKIVNEVNSMDTEGTTLELKANVSLHRSATRVQGRHWPMLSASE